MKVAVEEEIADKWVFVRFWLRDKSRGTLMLTREEWTEMKEGWVVEKHVREEFEDGDL